MMWLIASPESNRTQWPGRVSFQFIVCVIDAQSVSMIPVSADAPSLGWLIGPVTIRFQPAGVRKMPCVCRVTIPDPKIETGAQPGGISGSVRIWTSADDAPPFHMHQKPAGVNISQPWVFAIVSGRQR